MRLVWLTLFATLLAGCGSGGSGGTAADPAADSATVEIGTRAASAATVIYAAELVLHLPAGVTVSADPSSGLVPAEVLRPAASGALSGARYQPATATAQALVKVIISDPRGFAVGNLATLICTVAPGTTASTAGFSLDGFSARDANGAVMPEVTAQFALRAK